MRYGDASVGRLGNVEVEGVVVGVDSVAESRMLGISCMFVVRACV